MSITLDRLQRLSDERTRTEEKRQDVLKSAETDGERDLTDNERQLVEQYRSRVVELDEEIEQLADDAEREKKTREASARIRVIRESPPDGGEGGDGGDGGEGTPSPSSHRTFARYARDLLIVRYPMIAAAAGRDPSQADAMREAAQERLTRALAHTTTAEIEGLLPPQHMAQILDIIDGSRPVVTTARRVDLSRGKLTYPKIASRPSVEKQAAEKTLAGTAPMVVDLDEITADTYLGGGNLSWQAINWSTPDALALWFDLAAEAYARQTETAACASLEAAASGTASPPLGTSGSEDFGDWRGAVIGAIGDIYDQTSGRAQTDTLYLAADQFFALAGLGSDQTVQLSTVGNLNIAAMTGTFSGLRVVGSYGFQAGTRIIGDSQAFLVGETPGAPVEMRAVEPAIGGMEVGLIGAFKSAVFDPDRFLFLS